MLRIVFFKFTGTDRSGYVSPHQGAAKGCGYRMELGNSHFFFSVLTAKTHKAIIKSEGRASILKLKTLIFFKKCCEFVMEK